MFTTGTHDGSSIADRCSRKQCVSLALNRWRHIIVLKCLLDSRASYLGCLLAAAIFTSERTSAKVDLCLDGI